MSAVILFNRYFMLSDKIKENWMGTLVGCGSRIQ